jgi:cytochrome c biogenesis protein
MIAVVRRAWRRLISMRTALVLLFLLALASVPGSLLPQRPLNPSKVQTYLDTHGAWGTFLDRIGAFDVFGSVWFAAIYLLLFASLIGCLIPRITVYAKALRAKPIRAPRNLTRLAENDQFATPLGRTEAAEAAGGELKRRWRSIERNEESGAITVSAEKGYSREAGNLLFHVALLVSLVLIAVGRLYHYEGSVVLTEGKGFCNNLVSYDSFRSGREVSTGSLAPFCVDTLNSFTAKYRDDGSPEQFKADITYSKGIDGQPQHDVITVNHPLRIEGDRIYLINHGFSPTVTVVRPDGRRITQTAAFLPQDGNLTSEGALSFQGPGDNHDIGIEGLFAPTPVEQSAGVITSAAPQAKDPILAVFVYTGQLNPGGVPQSVYSLNQEQIANGKLTKVGAKNLKVGDSLILPDGTRVTFDGFKQWASMQVSHDPTQGMLLIAAVLMVVGLLGSLAIRRRRLWLRLTTDESGTRTLVEVGGLARNDSGNFTDEFAAVAERLRVALHADLAASTASPVGAGRD